MYDKNVNTCIEPLGDCILFYFLKFYFLFLKFLVEVANWKRADITR